MAIAQQIFSPWGAHEFVGGKQLFPAWRVADRNEPGPVSGRRRQHVTAVVPVTFKTQVAVEYDPDGAGRHLANLRRGARPAPA
jgi:hypothetical protein